jgi:steroid delta-isomerase-like uncharacterized protein
MRPSWGASHTPERFKVVRKNGPYGTYLGSIYSLAQQQPAHVGLRRIKLGGSLGNGKNAGTIDPKILSRVRNHFCYDHHTDAPRLLQALRQGAYRNAWHVMPAREPEGKELIMSEQNKALSRRNIEEVWNQRKLEVIDELVATSSVLHDPSVPGGKVAGSQGYRQFVQVYLTAFPDTHFTIHDQIADGDKVVTRWTATGTHKGDLMGIAPTGKRSTVTGITIDRYDAGKAIESWVNYDTLGMFQQLGVVPMLAPAGVKA